MIIGNSPLERKKVSENLIIDFKDFTEIGQAFNRKA